MKKISLHFWDRVGMCTSFLCMIHCMAVPLLFIFGIDSILILVDQEWLELSIIALSLVIGLVAFLRGFLRHKQHFIPVLFVSGFLLIINGEAVEPLFLKAFLSVVGASIIAYAHYHNLKLMRYASAS